VAINTLIFDFDGTLVDSETAHTFSTQAFLQRLGVAAPQGDAVGKGLLEFLRMTQSANPQLTLSLNELIEVFDEVFLEVAPKYITPFHKTILLARLAKTKGYTIAIASGTNINMLHKISALYGIDTIFGDAYYSSEHDKAGKPAPDLFLRTAKALGAKPCEVLVLEDSYPGYMAAQNAKMPVLMVPDARFTSQYTFNHAHLLFEGPNNLDIDTVFSFCENYH
jgi:beta-phosphoglucomutase-like phosphatase (HAD superfamily)